MIGSLFNTENKRFYYRNRRNGWVNEMTNQILDHPKMGEEAFELIWENTNDAIFLIGHDGAILQANPTFTEMLGWTIEEMQGLTLPPSLHNMTQEQHDIFINKLRDGENVNYSFTKSLCKDGEVLDILATYRAINKGEIMTMRLLTQQHSMVPPIVYSLLI
jgi:PAS domain S-box-containing protein